MKAKLPALVSLTVDGIDDEGRGCGVLREERLAADDVRLHVERTLPGEQITARVEHVSPHQRAGVRDAWGTLDEVRVASASRVQPICPAYGTCGGCVLQHLAYPAQLAWKRERVAAAFRALPRLPSAGVASVVEPCLASPTELAYRNQAKYVYGRTALGELTLGAYRPRSHELIGLVGCRLVEPPIDRVARVVLEEIRASKVEPFDERRRTGELRYVAVRANRRGEALVTLVRGREGSRVDASLAERIARAIPEAVGIVCNENPTSGNAIFGSTERTLFGRSFIEDEIIGQRVQLSSRSFFQINRGTAARAYELIVDHVRRAHEICPVRRIVDAYGGAGPIALALSHLGAEVVGVEINEAAVADAERSAQAAGRNNLQFVAGDAALALDGVSGADVVVLNPPRAGCSSGVLAAVARMKPLLILYLSCNPDTLARDLETLMGEGFSVGRAQPLDMHPHTPHVETLVVLRR